MLVMGTCWKKKKALIWSGFKDILGDSSERFLGIYTQGGIVTSHLLSFIWLQYGGWVK